MVATSVRKEECCATVYFLFGMYSTPFSNLFHCTGMCGDVHSMHIEVSVSAAPPYCFVSFSFALARTVLHRKFVQMLSHSSFPGCRLLFDTMLLTDRSVVSGRGK